MKTKEVNCLLFKRTINEQFGVECLYEETVMNEKQAMETIHRILNDGRRFYTFEQINFSFANFFNPDSNNTILSKKVISINIDNIFEIEYISVEIQS